MINSIEESLINGGECFDALPHERRHPVELCRPQESARRTAKGHDRLGAHNKMGYGAVTREHRAFQFDA